MSVPILEVVGLHAAYGRIEVLRGVDLKVPRGAVVALLGPNGGGKSTLLKVISGQMEKTSGHVHMAGVNVHGASADDLARLGLTTIPEGRSVFPNLTVEENLLLMSYAGVGADKVFDTAQHLDPPVGGVHVDALQDRNTHSEAPVPTSAAAWATSASSAYPR